MINHKSRLENSFDQFLHLIDDWINEESGWIVELIELNTLTFQLTDHYQGILM